MESANEKPVDAALMARLDMLSFTARTALDLALAGKTRVQIAKKLKVTRQRVSQIVKMLHRHEILDMGILPENPNMARQSGYERVKYRLTEANKSGLLGRIFQR